MNFKQYIIHNWDAVILTILLVIMCILYMKQKLNIKINLLDAPAMASKVYWWNFQFNIYFAVMAVFGIAILKFLGVDVNIPDNLYHFILVTTFFFSSVFVFSSLDSLVRYSIPYIKDILVAKITGVGTMLHTPPEEGNKENGTQTTNT